MPTLLLLSLGACGGDPEATDAQLPEIAADEGDWVRLHGTIVAALPTQFILATGNAMITVELDDEDSFPEALALLPGDRVSVTGRVDANLFSAKSIEARAVHVHNRNTIYFASAADEEELPLARPGRQKEGADYVGEVTGTFEGGLTLGAGSSTITVDTTQLNAPSASRLVAPGDEVYVWGNLILDDQGGSTLAAEGLVELAKSLAPIAAAAS